MIQSIFKGAASHRSFFLTQTAWVARAFQVAATTAARQSQKIISLFLLCVFDELHISPGTAAKL